ncbi:hypothetical protein M0812_26595 [Anaeramoeba flamelloides]|uniref:Uncharacterized protein n=1 Tax=Anaeramoeba flamelloides TaxID=1746091 RepID=A0AAV7YBY9_9EUKA|nr:hypothetical protein M0812_26595 [Anaeramoeba flamelloides]
MFIGSIWKQSPCFVMSLAWNNEKYDLVQSDIRRYCGVRRNTINILLALEQCHYFESGSDPKPGIITRGRLNKRNNMSCHVFFQLEDLTRQNKKQTKT